MKTTPYVIGDGICRGGWLTAFANGVCGFGPRSKALRFVGRPGANAALAALLDAIEAKGYGRLASLKSGPPAVASTAPPAPSPVRRRRRPLPFPLAPVPRQAPTRSPLISPAPRRPALPERS